MSFPATFSLFCLLLGQFSSRGVITGIEGKSLPNDGDLPGASNHTITNIRNTSFSANNFTEFNNATNSTEGNNDSLESLESDILSGNYSSIMINSTGSGVLTLDETSLLSSSLIFTKAGDHYGNLSAVVVEENLDDVDNSTDSEQSTPNEMWTTMPNLVGSVNNTSDANDIMPSSETGNDGGLELGESIISTIQNMLHFSNRNSTSNSTDSGWTTDPTGMEIQALMFA